MILRIPITAASGWPRPLSGHVSKAFRITRRPLAIAARLSQYSILHAFPACGRCFQQQEIATWLRMTSIT
jgi:hypothetical protein